MPKPNDNIVKKATDNAEKLQVIDPTNDMAFNVTAPAKHKTVLHLLDMENENANPHKRKINGYAILSQINIASNSDAPSETVSMIFVNQFSKSKN